MLNPADVVEALGSTNSRLEKEKILQQAWDNGIREFFQGTQLALDALVTFGIARAPLIEEDDEGGSFSWQEFSALAQRLQRRELTGNSARDEIRSAAERAPARLWNLWYRRLLLKDLKVGVTEATINKVLAANGAEGKKYLVPVFSCQLAKPAEDHPKKMRGRKLLDRKYDGVRLLTVLDKQAGTVRQFSRDGREKNNFPKLLESLERLLPVINESLVLDGEVISSNFQTLMTQVNRQEDVDTSDCRLILFDIVSLKDFRSGVCRISQQDRHLALCELIPLFVEFGDDRLHVEPKLEVDLDTQEGAKAMNEFNQMVLAEGLEGVMIKDPAAPYQCKRSDAWLKIKPSIAVDLTVVAVEPGTAESKFSHTMGNLVCEGVDQGRNIRVEVGSGFSEDLRDQIWAHRAEVVGRVVEIKGDALTQNQQNQEVWSLRFPVFLRFRGWEPGEKI